MTREQKRMVLKNSKNFLNSDSLKFDSEIKNMKFIGIDLNIDLNTIQHINAVNKNIKRIKL